MGGLLCVFYLEAEMRYLCLDFLREGELFSVIGVRGAAAMKKGS